MKKNEMALKLEQLQVPKLDGLGQRKHKRYKPDPNTPALIDMINQDTQFFEPTLMGLVTEESFGGIRVVVAADYDLAENLIFKVKVGKKHPILAEVRWFRRVDANTLILGVKYLS